MDLLMLISSSEAGEIAGGLARACHRAGIHWAVFLTNDGVKILEEQSIADAMKQADTAIACQDSWSRHMQTLECPLELGSQTSNSALISQAVRLVSL